MSKEQRFRSTFENLECDHRQLLASGTAMKTLNIRDPPSSAALAAAWSTGSTRTEKGKKFAVRNQPAPRASFNVEFLWMCF